MAKGRKPGRPPADHNRIKTLVQLEPDIKTKLKILAAREDKHVSDLVNEAAELLIKEYEKKHGPLL